MQFRNNLDGLCFRVNIVHIASALAYAFNGCLTGRNDSLDIGTNFGQFSPSREISGIPFVPNQGSGIFRRSFGECSPGSYSFQFEVHHEGGRGSSLFQQANLKDLSWSYFLDRT